MSGKEERINPYKVLGVSDDRADKMIAELTTLKSESQYVDEILTSLTERYDCESLAMGMFLASMIMKCERRLLPPGATIVGSVPLPTPVHDPSQN